ncbi:MAG: haloacid dehalogenase-like hydrolase [Desulfobulbus sp.]|nr:haloacid dehalogenase-like hydrolase [Desulfobulbus sp.]
MNRVQTIVFDFDHTLTPWDSSERFFRWLLKRSPWRSALVLVSIPFLAPLLLGKNTRTLPVKFAVWTATLGRSDDAVSALVKEHVAEIVARRQSLILQDGIRQLNRHLAQGHRVVVATGSLEALGRELLDQSGLAHIPMVGSSLKPFMWGMVAHQHCYGPRKIPMLTERGYPPPWVATYTDHECDLPVMRQSAACFLVNPRPKAVRIIADELSITPEVLLWR